MSSWPPPVPTADDESPKKPSKLSAQRVGAAVVVGVGVLAAVVQITGFSLRDLWSEERTPTVEGVVSTPAQYCKFVEGLQGSLGEDRTFDVRFDELTDHADDPFAEEALRLEPVGPDIEGSKGEAELSISGVCGGVCFLRLDFLVPAEHSGEGTTYQGMFSRYVHGTWKVANIERLGTCMWVYTFRFIE